MVIRVLLAQSDLFLLLFVLVYGCGCFFFFWGGGKDVEVIQRMLISSCFYLSANLFTSIRVETARYPRGYEH